MCLFKTSGDGQFGFVALKVPERNPLNSECLRVFCWFFLYSTLITFLFLCSSGLLKEVELLAKEKLELQCQAEKDHSNLRSQMKVLEVELEEQLHSNQDLAKQLLEVAELKQQIQVLEKQLKKQRQFMDVSKLDIMLSWFWM